jgi:2,5-diketo-D-gluconate reductase B
MDIPRLGLGTRQLLGDECYTTVLQALQMWYTHIDTAAVYHNEDIIGQAIMDSGIYREKIRLTTKIFVNHYQTTELILQSIHHSLSELQTTYLDLVLLHRPTNHEEHHLVFDTFLALQSQGIIKHIGVSNFNSEQLLDAISYTNNNIYAYQWEYHICLDQNKILSICKENNVLFEAYSPLAHGKLWNNLTIINALNSIANKHQISPSQVMLSWLRSQHIIILPKTTKRDHLFENMMLDHITLDEEDKITIDWFPKDFRYCNPSQIAPIWDQ